MLFVTYLCVSKLTHQPSITVSTCKYSSNLEFCLVKKKIHLNWPAKDFDWYKLNTPDCSFVCYVYSINFGILKWILLLHLLYGLKFSLLTSIKLRLYKVLSSITPLEMVSTGWISHCCTILSQNDIPDSVKISQRHND